MPDPGIAPELPKWFIYFSKNGDLVFDRMQAISGLEEHLGELESVESDLDYELGRLKQSSDVTLEILRRCKSEKGED